MTVRDMIHVVDPYEGLDVTDYEPDVQGWGGHPEFFGRMVEKTKPKLIVEVGTWKGKSAIAMATVCRDLGLDTEIVCVDTWLGATEFWTKKEDPKRYQSLKLVNGYPTVYYTFLKNVKKLRLEKYITPFPQTSTNAARFMNNNLVKADLIYIDGSHEFEDVELDLRAWTRALKVEGTMFGDDYCMYWHGVILAVHDHARLHNTEVSVTKLQNGPGEAASDYWEMKL